MPAVVVLEAAHRLLLHLQLREKFRCRNVADQFLLLITERCSLPNTHPLGGEHHIEGFAQFSLWSEREGPQSTSLRIDLSVEVPVVMEQKIAPFMAKFGRRITV